MNYEQRLEQNEQKVKEIIIKQLNLSLKPEEIDTEREYFLESYGFNSIDALELLLRIEQEFEIEMSDEDLNIELIKTVKSLATYVTDALDKGV